MPSEIETRLLEAAERLEEKLEQRAEEVRENEAALLGHLEKGTEQFQRWGEDLKGWDKRWRHKTRLETRLSVWEKRLGALEKQLGDLSRKLGK